MKIKVIAFDADDTLWDCQSHFAEVECQYAMMLAPYGDMEYITQELFKVETANMPELGYGCKAFILSLIENAVKVSKGKIAADKLLEILSLGRTLLRLPATPLPEVEETLRTLHQQHRYQLVAFTKGELQDQVNKLQRSGLSPYFDDVIVVEEKSVEAYQHLCSRMGICFSDLLSVGNSFKSDIEPVLLSGGYAVHIPFAYIWAYERTKEYTHKRLHTITRFGELLPLLEP